MFLKRNTLSLFVTAASTFGVVAISPTVFAQNASENAAAEVEEVVVTGFRQAVAAALDNKRDAANSKESIVAEDLGKMVDLNLAEAMQRVPGVAIVREGGEGRQISLRGLGAEFTHVTLNGMEVPSSAGGLDSSGGVNRSRDFDFNVFSADLFSRIDVNKSAMASIEEGGIAGSVDLYTARPLDNPGRKFVMSGQLGYNDLSSEIDPRLTFIYSDSNEEETIGWMISAARTERTSFQDGFGTVRWDSPFLDGNKSFKANNSNQPDDVVNGLWYPRLPRQDSFHHVQDRTGISAALEMKPSDEFKFGLNYVTSEFNAVVDSYNSFAQFRRNGQWGWPHNTVEEVVIATDGGEEYAVYGKFSGVGLRTESRRQTDVTKFAQLTSDFEWQLTENLTLTGMVGQADSRFNEQYFRANVETLKDDQDPLTTENTTDGGVVFSYDFRPNANVAMIEYDIDVTDVKNFYLMDNEVIRDFDVDRKNLTKRVDLNWDISETHNAKFGVMQNDREVDSVQSQQNDPIPSDLAAISKVYTYDDAGGFGGKTELNFLALDFDKAIPAFGRNLQTVRGGGIQTWTVRENAKSVYGEYNLNTELAGHGVRANAGLRYVQTKTAGLGWAGESLPVFETNSYSNMLPSVNVTYDIVENMLVRVGAAKTMTRAGLSDLAPITTYSDVNKTVRKGNSQLDPLISTDLNVSWEWYFADESMVAVGLFSKDIDSFISSPPVKQQLREVDVENIQSIYPEQPTLWEKDLTTELRPIWEYRESANTDGTELNGWEIAYQQSLSFLPSFLSNFGVLANYSYVDATTMVSRNNILQSAPLEGMSQNSYNATVYYEVDDWGARMSFNSRDDYVTRNIGSNNNASEATTGPTHVDFSAFYNINDNLTLNFEVVNLTDVYERLYTTGENNAMNLVREYNHTGRQMFLGLRAKF